MTAPRVAPPHVCPGCATVKVPNHQLACPPCWLRLPVELRSTLDRTYRFRVAHPSPWHQAIRRCLEWFKNNPPEVAGATT